MTERLRTLAIVAITLMTVACASEDAGPTRTVLTPPGDHLRTEYSRDGSILAYTRREDGKETVMFANPDGTGHRSSGYTSSYVANLAWSPDGTSLAI